MSTEFLICKIQNLLKVIIDWNFCALRFNYLIVAAIIIKGLTIKFYVFIYFSEKCISDYPISYCELSVLFSTVHLCFILCTSIYIFGPLSFSFNTVRFWCKSVSISPLHKHVYYENGILKEIIYWKHVLATLLH